MIPNDDSCRLIMFSRPHLARAVGSQPSAAPMQDVSFLVVATVGFLGSLSMKTRRKSIKESTKSTGPYLRRSRGCASRLCYVFRTFSIRVSICFRGFLLGSRRISGYTGRRKKRFPPPYMAVISMWKTLHCSNVRLQI